jgi:hypothetical protein
MTISDINLPDCSSAAIFRMATKLANYWREGSTFTAIPPASASNIVGQYNKIGDITFEAHFVYAYKTQESYWKAFFQ